MINLNVMCSSQQRLTLYRVVLCHYLQGEKYANAMRFQIVGGRLYLDFTRFRAPNRQLKADEVPYWFPGDVRPPSLRACLDVNRPQD